MTEIGCSMAWLIEALQGDYVSSKPRKKEYHSCADMCNTQEKKLQYNTSWESDATRFYVITHRPSEFAQAACRCMLLQAYATAATVSRALEVRLV